MVRATEPRVSITAPEEDDTPSPSEPHIDAAAPLNDVLAPSPARTPVLHLTHLSSADSPPQVVWQLQVGTALSSLTSEVSEKVETAFQQGQVLFGFTLDSQVWLIEFAKGVARDSAGHEVPVRRVVVKSETGPPSHRSLHSSDSSPTMAVLHAPSPSVQVHLSKRLSFCSSLAGTSSSASLEASPMYSPLHSPSRHSRRTLDPTAGQVVEWYFTTDEQPWTPYDPILSAQIEAAFVAESPMFFLVVPGYGIHAIDVGILQQCDVSPPAVKLLRVQSGPGERCLKCQRRLKWRLKSMEAPDTEEYICGDCERPCDKSLDGFVHCPRCRWYICRSCEQEGEEFAQRKRQERLKRKEERRRRRELRAMRQDATESALGPIGA
eukprot:GGOE01005566.1.p1 GENE.GGOE01005566.1~~GGOE01005566.1.p1  ORF type:complete len:379 (-),score=56.37 GGOE01005566.1:688-1824(-)